MTLLSGRDIVPRAMDQTRLTTRALFVALLLLLSACIKVDQRLSLRNDDDKAVVIGPFFVAPRETSTYRFSSPRVIVGACDLHPSGEFTVEVTA